MGETFLARRFAFFLNFRRNYGRTMHEPDIYHIFFVKPDENPMVTKRIHDGTPAWSDERSPEFGYRKSQHEVLKLYMNRKLQCNPIMNLEMLLSARDWASTRSRDNDPRATLSFGHCVVHPYMRRTKKIDSYIDGIIILTISFSRFEIFLCLRRDSFTIFGEGEI
jgi:hypothetical protein